MRIRVYLSVIIILFALAGNAQTKRYDTSMKLGKVGYRVFTNNRSIDKNIVTISPIGFDNTAREVSIDVKGKVARSEVDDLDRDGFPDLVIYVYTGGEKNTGTVVGIRSDKNQGFAPIYFPDIVDDAKLKAGYIGHDEFMLMEGTLTRRFPVYTTADTTNIKPTGIMRQVMYRVVPDEKGIQKFKVMRSYEFNKQ
jgi:hypothetical protein